MTDEEAAKKWVNNNDIPGDFTSPWTMEIFDGYPCPHCGHHPEKAFLAGIKYGERKGWDMIQRAWIAARHPDFDRMTFEDWKKEQETK